MISTVNQPINSYRAGQSAYNSGHYDKAAAAFRWASGLDPNNPVFSHAAALSAARAGDDVSAEWLFVRAILRTKRQLGARHPFLLLVARDLAAYYRGKGRGEEMAKLAGRIVARADPPAVARSGDLTLRALADLCGMVGRLSAALPFYQSALDSRREQYGDRHPRTVACIAGLAELHRKLGDAGKAQLLREEARTVREVGSSGGVAAGSFIPRLADYDPFDGTRRAAARHRRPASLDHWLRCAPLVVCGTTARTAPCQRTRETGQKGHNQRALVLSLSATL